MPKNRIQPYQNDLYKLGKDIACGKALPLNDKELQKIKSVLLGYDEKARDVVFDFINSATKHNQGQEIVFNNTPDSHKIINVLVECLPEMIKRADDFGSRRCDDQPFYGREPARTTIRNLAPVIRTCPDKYTHLIPIFVSCTINSQIDYHWYLALFARPIGIDSDKIRLNILMEYDYPALVHTHNSGISYSNSYLDFIFTNMDVSCVNNIALYLDWLIYYHYSEESMRKKFWHFTEDQYEKDLSAGLLQIKALLNRLGTDMFSAVTPKTFDCIYERAFTESKIPGFTDAYQIGYKKIFKQMVARACIGLQDLELPALVTLEIIDALCPNDFTMFFKWEIIKKVKHSVF